jgi:predicted metalloprotease with PDZ domain
VYEKGALIGMCLDIKLRKLSGGTYGLQNLIADLSMKYGKNKAFQDEALFDEIAKLTYPEIGEFLKRYVGGDERLPYQELLNEVGVNYAPELTTFEFNLGFEAKDIAIAQHNEKPKLSIVNSELLNAQGKALGFATGDILMKVNGEPLPDLGPDLKTFFEKQKTNLKDGTILSYTVIRTNEAHEKKEIELKAPVMKSVVKNKFVFEFDQEASPEKLALRKSWLTGTN